MNEKKQEIVKKEKTAVQSVSPAQMIMQAVQGNADLDKLHGLLDLQMKYEANEAKKAYHVAMSQFKANPPQIVKDKQVAYKEVKYKHASLYNVTKSISTELSKHGLSASWNSAQNGGVTVTCKITHAKGHSEQTSLTAQPDASGSKNSIQQIGSTITYLERYTLLMLTGLATADQDDDGKSVDVEHIDDKQVIQIMDILNNEDVNKAHFLTYLKVDSVHNIPADKFNVAMSALKNSVDHKKKGSFKVVDVEKEGNESIQQR